MYSEQFYVLVAEIEAREACDWLKAAGFPQYAQLFEDMQFPIDVKTVRKDHEFLDGDAIESLFRRLNTLNKCASMKVEISRQRKRSDDSEDDEPCAISNKWAYERCRQRWSRIESLEGFPGEEGASASVPGSPVLKSISNEAAIVLDHGEKHDVSSIHSTSSGDSDILNLKNDVKLRTNQMMFQIPQGHKPGTFPKVLTNSSSPVDNSSINWRTGSFHGCRRSWSRSSSKDSKAPRSPLSCTDNRLSVYDNMPNIELDKLEAIEVGDDDVFSELNDVIEDVNGLKKLVDQWTEKFLDDGDLDFASDLTPLYPSSPKEICLETEESEEKRADLPATEGESSCEMDKEISSAELACMTDCQKTNRHGKQHWSMEESVNLESLSIQTDSQSAARTQKLALLKLTALMDRYSPSSKQGWNWTIPKFIKKIKASDYKDKNVFGVPLLLNVQRTSRPLPNGILQALDYLRSHFLDQVGLFRKSGVKSRILSLREMNETNPNNVCYEGQSAFDVADMVKQYFRDLPEPIFTSRLCESFLHIYQYVPKDQQFQAVQAAILLLPKENREALKILLFFLRDVVAFVEENQMTPTNIAVCLAPSLFHLNTLRRDSSSSSTSQRKCSLGKPDQRELSENLAATQGLAHMIMECNRLFQTDFPA
ncbi:PREDICTED: rho GTPase-activating protein 7-like [Tauraco erythrolophus]|uniref:rho GTPase-activating protein 7-like n=1 Tax=Tauraco erythrolophus TaxID=121530 RepID=UPI00052346A0|nr:PREDICTED: rho GTPase-activating protein 7-like [Tauraco erythrolophus]